MTRQNLLVFLILTVIISCKENDKISFSKSLVKIHQADTITKGIDTVYLVMGNSIRLQSRWDNEGDTLGLLIFDSEGRLSSRINPFENFSYHYDSAGLLDSVRWRDWDITNHFVVKYDVSEDSLIIKQIYSDIFDRKNRYELVYIYRFNKHGLLINKEFPAAHWSKNIWDYIIYKRALDQKALHKPDTTLSRITYKYLYDTHNRILNIETWSNSMQFTGRISNEVFYYSSHLDSSILSYDYLKYRVKRYFDTRGLERQRLYADSLKVNFIYR